MLKKSLLVLTLAAMTGSAFAAPVANLKVSGSVKQPTCTVNGIVDEVDVLYTFDVSPGQFPATGNKTLPSQTKSIQVVCDATTYLAFTTTDERATTALITSNTNFGLGLYGDSTKVGYYTISMKNATVKADENASEISVGVLIGNAVHYDSRIDKTKTMSWGRAQNHPEPGRIFTADYEVEPTLNSVLKNSDGTATLDGHAVLVYAFGM
ncbi:fimbrial protein [Serratia fonticola]